MIILMGSCVLPNKWVLNLITCVFIGVSFIIVSPLVIPKLDPNAYLAAAVYVVLIMFMSSLFMYNINFNKRMLFIKNKRLEELAFHDVMTGLYSKSKFDAEVRRWIRYSKRYGTPLSLSIFDLDDFKAFNDRYGHITADRIIVDVSCIMKTAVRSQNILARWGGDEFALLMPNTEVAGAQRLIERLRFMLGEYFRGDVRATFSFGVTQLLPEDDEISFITRADRLLYKAKEDGKDKVAFAE
jgi:diguanylate cyclase (GGDEF)-like protein